MEIVKDAKRQFGIDEVIWHSDPVTREELYQVVLFTAGEGVIQLDFDTYEIKSPTLLFISEYQLFTTLVGNNVKGKVIQFSNDFFCIKLNRTETFCDAVIFNLTKPPLVPLSDKESNKINFIIDQIQDELITPSIYKEEIITSQLKTLLLESAKIKLQKMGQHPVQKLSSVVADFQDLLEENYKREHQVQFYANHLFISPKGLNNATKRELGKTTSELIKEKIIIEAKRELYQGKKTIKEIAFELGFEDPAYFSRFFKKSTSKSPKAFLPLH
ncbi:MAG: helix-turn-helix transcriptional regulator [Saprospiraceae bacterium]|nr:helix-turn-helix transcriptional regulator [Saprospiraceae bacterium]